MDVDIRVSIAAALGNRRAQREPVARLHGAWQALADCLDTLIATISEAGGLFGALGRPTPDQLMVTREIADERSRNQTQELRHRLATLASDIEAIRRRVHRETVNVGVIGRAQAGKSTLLRTITGLGEETIPSTKLNPTTAARSRMLHTPGRADAEISLLSWEQFRDGYLAPLHKEAGCDDPVPRTPDDFLGYPYKRMLESFRSRPGSESGLIQQKFLKRLCVAQESFGSYRELLTGQGRKLRIERLADLRPYVAYPENETDRRRPYHAVRDVRIYCPFPGVDVESLVLVDLPGAGEAGLDIDRQFLQDLKNEVDVLLQIKRPTEGHAFFEEEDWEVLSLADAARMGVQTADFVYIVINSDPTHVVRAALDNAVAKAREIAERNGLRLLVGDVANESGVRDHIFAPVLQGLANRLAAMDRAAANAVVTQASSVAEQAIELADRLAADVTRWEAHIPDEEQALRDQAKLKRNDVAQALDGLRKQYDRRVRDNEPVPELSQGITRAKEMLTKWAGTGFGMGSQKEWLAVIEPAMVADPGETRDDQCSLARQKIREEFSQIDSSLDSAVGRLHLAVAEALRDQFDARLVPAGDQALSALLETARQRQLETLTSALDDLVQFRTNYGNVFLRVGRPIVRQIAPTRGRVAGEHATSTPTDNPPDNRAANAGPSLYDGARKAASAASAANAAGAAPMVAAGLAAVQVAAAAAPIIADWIWHSQITDDSAAGLHEALAHAFNRAVEQIAERMRTEAGELTEVLAALVDQFFDRFTRTPGVEDEFVKLCRPIRHELWPETFDGRTADLTDRLSQIADAASASSKAAREVLAAAASIGSSDG
jgi:hypothetical protein